ncbi:MAG: hypothetical protein EAZ92_12745 [Candidatus Kapaibacterium sp.]|nr:MAG: hypothetical protein EAZ92_12745 [Candidatus Kapabacteria bacterium]
MNILKQGTTQRLIACCALFFLALAGCAVQGPAGPAGPQGPPGPVGPQGPAGTGGGTAAPTARTINFTVQPSQWLAQGVGSPGAYLQSGWFNVANITADIMATGVVLVYSQMQAVSATAVIWQQLPITFSEGGTFQVVDAQYQLGQVQVFINSPSGVAPFRPTRSFSYRVVAIPATTTAELKQFVDISNYNAVKAAFHLAE